MKDEWSTSSLKLWYWAYLKKFARKTLPIFYCLHYVCSLDYILCKLCNCLLATDCYAWRNFVVSCSAAEWSWWWAIWIAGWFLQVFHYLRRQLVTTYMYNVGTVQSMKLMKIYVWNLKPNIYLQSRQRNEDHSPQHQWVLKVGKVAIYDLENWGPCGCRRSTRTDNKKLNDTSLWLPAVLEDELMLIPVCTRS